MTSEILPGHAYTFEFTNHRGKTAARTVIARSLSWGETPWHKGAQFFFLAFDLEKQEVREFPFERIQTNSFRRLTDVEVDAFLTLRFQLAADAAVAAMQQSTHHEESDAASEGT